MKIADCRKQGKTILFKELVIGSVFEHTLNKRIFMKIDPVNIPEDRYPAFVRNAIDLETADLWNFNDDSLVHPLDARLVIDDY